MISVALKTHPEIRLGVCICKTSLLHRPRAYARGGLGLTPPLDLDILQNFITCAKEINCFRILFACSFVDLMQIPRNKFACKFQRTL